MFSYEIFKKHLKSKKINYKINYIESIDSTNQYAWELIKKNIEIPSIIITKNQTNGRGQRDNQWFSSINKSLTFSIIINQNKKYENLLPLKVAIAIIEGIKKNTNIDCNLKWPNDIMKNNKKIGGILIEKRRKKIVIGIGINVNENLKDINPIIKNKSTSLKIINNLSVKLEMLLANILNEFELYYYQLNNQNIIKKWEKYCCHINKNIKFYKNHKMLKGEFLGIKNDGNAIININGKKYTTNSGIINL